MPRVTPVCRVALDSAVSKHGDAEVPLTNAIQITIVFGLLGPRSGSVSSMSVAPRLSVSSQHSYISPLYPTF